MSAYRDEKTKTWYVKFRYTDWQKNSKHTTKRGFKTKKEALNYEYDFKSKSKDRVEITIANLVKDYLEDKKLRVKDSTYVSVEQAMKHHVLPFLAKLALHDLTPTIMRRWQNEIIKLNLSPSTTRKIYLHCSNLLNFAVKYYGLKQNPLRLVGSIGKSESSMNFWELDEFTKFIKVVDSPRYKIMFLLLFFSGMREGELLALDVSDFDFTSNNIIINKNKLRSNGQITTTKTPNSIRTIEMPSNIMQEVKTYIDTLSEPPSPLFNITHRALLMAFDKYIKRAGIKKIRIHDLRHSHVSFLIHINVQITAISRRLGHKSPDITLGIYSHMYNQTGSQVASKLQEVVNVSQILVDDNGRNT